MYRPLPSRKRNSILSGIDAAHHDPLPWLNATLVTHNFVLPALHPVEMRSLVFRETRTKVSREVSGSSRLRPLTNLLVRDGPSFCVHLQDISPWPLSYPPRYGPRVLSVLRCKSCNHMQGTAYRSISLGNHGRRGGAEVETKT